jgi:hypothetical protein
MQNQLLESISKSKIYRTIATVMTIMCIIMIILFSVDLGKNIFPAVKFEWKIVALIINILAIPAINSILISQVGRFAFAR